MRWMNQSSHRIIHMHIKKLQQKNFTHSLDTFFLLINYLLYRMLIIVFCFICFFFWGVQILIDLDESNKTVKLFETR